MMTHTKSHWLLTCLAGAVLMLSVLPAFAQDARELEGERSANRKLKGEHALVELMRSRTSRLQPELVGVHPRVYVTEQEISELRRRARTTQKTDWQAVLADVRALQGEPPPPPAQRRRDQNEVGLAIAEAAFVYKIEGDKKYLEAAKKYMDAACSYQVWGYANNKPDADLAAGHLLYGMGWAYDLLYHDLSDTERARYRSKLIRQSRLMFDFFKPKSGKTYAYSQNHTFIPIAGLGIAAYALYDEAPDAPQWAALARAIYDRVLATYSTDGYYYEGFEYWIFSTPWLVHYLDALAHAAGEDLYDRPGFRLMHKYVAQAMLPGGDNVFDFGDVYSGPETRAKKGEDYERTHPAGHYSSNYNLLYRLAGRFQNGEAQGVARWLKSMGQVNAEEFWSLLWYDGAVKEVPIERQERWHYFPDHEVVYWRSSWSSEATAFAFKCGPPEGHHTGALLAKFPEWRLSAGHSHPDANSFIVYANGHYLTGDSGYAGVPLTQHHNTVLIGGRGQGLEGQGHDPWDGVSYDQLNKIGISEVKFGPTLVTLRANAAAAYMPELGLKRFERSFRYAAGDGFTISDQLESETPQIFTALLHADQRIAPLGPGSFVIDAGGAKMSVNIEIPKNARTIIETNELITPGPPGAVDKGERVERGRRIAVSNLLPARSVQFVMHLKVIGQR
ncbi:MAG: Heparinase II/III-like protein [Acidobacteria bacterium]|nr:Heparinase II/III-like protein [Acidobacteriota bacterium]